MKVKQIIFVLSVMICVFCCSALIACEDPPETFRVFYGATEGGHIEGEVYQFVDKGKNAQTVVAVPDESYVFVKWSDEIYEATRTDKKLTNHLSVTAIFEKENFSIKYEAGEGGYIDGNTNQNIEIGQLSEPVTAIPYDEYVFVKWSDDYPIATRADRISERTTLTACFEKVGTIFEYVYSNATENADSKSVFIKYTDKLSEVKLPTPIRINSIFEGWYLDKEFTKKVADEKGNILTNADLFADETNKFYAKFSLIEDVTFKILMVYITNVDYTLIDCRNLKPIECKYTITDLDRKICEEFSRKVEESLNEIFAGWVNIKVSSYFSARTVVTDDFVTKERYFEEYDHTANEYYFLTAPELDARTLSEYNYVYTVLPTPSTKGGYYWGSRYSLYNAYYQSDPIEGRMHNLIGLRSLLYNLNFSEVLHNESNLHYLSWEQGINYFLRFFCDDVDNQRRSFTETSLSQYSCASYLNQAMKYYGVRERDALTYYLTNRALPMPDEERYEGCAAIPYEFWKKLSK